MNSKLRDRRQFIKLASGLLVTPFASLTGGSAIAQNVGSPLRMLTIIDSYGLPAQTRDDIWVRSPIGDYPLLNTDLGTTLAPLQAYRDNMLVVSGINMDSLGGDSRIHQHMTRHTLTGSQKLATSPAGEPAAKIPHASLDVHVGEHLNNNVGLGRAFPHLFFTNISQSGKQTFCYDLEGNQIRSIAGSRNQAETIFANNTDLSEIQFQNLTQQTVFELVQERILALRGQLTNANASMVMDAYESSVDELAAQLHVSSNNVCGAPVALDSYPTTDKQSTVSTPYIFKNIQQAFACDLTSSLTYHIGGEQINQLKHRDLFNPDIHPEGVGSQLSNNMHAVSHAVSDNANMTHELIRIHQAELVAELLDAMSIMPDVDGSSVLDNTVMFWTCAMANNTHSKTGYPYLLIAGKNTNLQGGFHYDCTGNTNNDLLTTIAQGLNLPDERFGGFHASGEDRDALHNGAISRMLAA